MEMVNIWTTRLFCKLKYILWEKTQEQTQVLFRQIAGAVARRIVNYAQEDNQAIAGKEYGFIKFGSRVDIFLPLGTQIDVKVGDITKGGIQKIGELK